MLTLENASAGPPRSRMRKRYLPANFTAGLQVLVRQKPEDASSNRPFAKQVP